MLPSAPLRLVLATVLVSLSSVAAPPAQREADVPVVLTTTADGGVTGQVTRVTVRLARNKSRVPSVGVLAATSAPQDQWLPTLWQAAFIATEATQTSLLDFELSLRVSEPVLDASAGLMTTSTLVALARGKKVLPNTTMVGAINPDGSAGWVDDALPRLRAAATAGVKRFGVPVGARQQPGEQDTPVDLVLEGKRLGVEVTELSGLDDAARFLTGAALPRPEAATEADMELWPAELATIRRYTAELQRALEADQAPLDEALKGVSPAAASALRTRLERTARQAADFERAGDPVRAFVVWNAALTMTRVATQDAQLVQALEAKDSAKVLAVLDAQRTALPAERLELRHDIDTRFPHTSRAYDMYAMDVLESIVTQGSAFSAEDAAKALKTSAAAPDFAARARQVAEDLLRGREDLRNGQRFVSLYAALPKLKKSLPPLDAERLATSYVAAIGGTPLSPLARQDPGAAELEGYAALLRTEVDPRARLVLAARQRIYSAHLVNLYEALGAEPSSQGALSLRHSRTLTSQLEYARAHALQSCGRAKREASMVPLAARLRYLNARAAREGSDRQKAESLADLWVASWWCELAVSR